MRFVSWKDARAVTQDLRAIYQAATESQGLQALDAFEKKWPNYALAVQSWRNNWHHVATLFAYPCLLYTSTIHEQITLTYINKT